MEVKKINGKLVGADLTGADLTGLNLSFTDLSFADLTGADLAGADLSYANLTGANLTDVDLSDVNLENTIGNRIEIFTSQLTGITAVFTKEKIQIGKESHTCEEWDSFEDEEIKKMFEFPCYWEENKEMIFSMYFHLFPQMKRGW